VASLDDREKRWKEKPKDETLKLEMPRLAVVQVDSHGVDGHGE